MKREELTRLKKQLVESSEAIAPSNLCKDFMCQDCIFRRAEGACATQDIDDKISLLAAMVDKAISEIKNCSKCGHELDGEI